MIARTPQSVNMPIHTDKIPRCSTRIMKIEPATRHSHIVSEETSIVNLTSPAALNPYAGMKLIAQKIGFTIVISSTIFSHSAAASGSIPASLTTGPAITYTIVHDEMITTSAHTVSFLM